MHTPMLPLPSLPSPDAVVAVKPNNLQDDGSYPLPPDDALVKQFSLDEFKGKWYISAGLNPLFDIFDCQVRDGWIH